MVPFFAESLTAFEKTFHDQKAELRADGTPIPVDKNGFDGKFLGQFNLHGQFSGRGVLLQKRSLYEGYFKNG